MPESDASAQRLTRVDRGAPAARERPTVVGSVIGIPVRSALAPRQMRTSFMRPTFELLSEPLVRQPLHISFDERGRFSSEFVLEDSNVDDL